MSDDDDIDAEPPTTAASDGEDIAAAPTEHATELIETSAAPAPELAWSDASEEQTTDAVGENRSRALWLTPVMALSVAVIAVVSALLFYVHRTPAPNATAPSQSSGNARPAPPALDGTYRLDLNREKQTQNGAPAPQPNTDANTTSWWAFRSPCRSTGCVAAGTGLDTNNHQLARTPAATADFHFVDGHWQGTFIRQVPQPRCLAPNEEVVAGSYTEQFALSFEPQAGGTLRGFQTITALTNECGFEGTVVQIPLVVTRIGDVPPGVAVADSATFTASPTMSTPDLVAGGPVLDGIFRVNYDVTHETEWWAFRSMCTTKGCSATGSKQADTNHDEGTGVATVLHFVDGHWQDTPCLQPPSQCSGANGTANDSKAHGWSLNPQPDGTLAGVETITVLTNECGKQGTISRIPMVVARMGDVPATATLADPALF